MIRLLPGDIVRITQGQSEDEQFESDKVIRQLSRKVPVLITTDGIADLPAEMLKKNGVPVIPFKIAMNGALFSDDREIDSNVILRYQGENAKEIIPCAPLVDDYKEFFSGLLSGAQHIIHIAAAKNVGSAYANACEAAMDFYSVSVFDSGQLSGGVGIMAMEAKALVDGGISDTEEILRQLEEKRERLRALFLLRSPEHFAMQFMKEDLVRLIKDFEIYPVIGLRDSTIKTERMLFGDYERNRKKFIRRALRNTAAIDPSLLLISYAGVKREELEKIREEALSMVDFERVIEKQASPSVTIYCGPGTIGLFFAEKYEKTAR